MRLRTHVLLTKIYVNATPRYLGMSLPGRAASAESSEAMDESLRSGWTQGEKYFMTCGEPLFAIWFVPVFPSELP
jgi:hypothetical protein